MAYYPHLNDIFMTDRLKRRLGDIDRHPITTVIAPMGFGKTTSLNWWAQQLLQNQAGAIALRQMVVTGSITDFWAGFCRVFKSYAELHEQIKALGYPKDDGAIAVLAQLLNDALPHNTHPIYYILDDLHILGQTSLTPLLLFLSRSLPDYVHIILLSRNEIFTQGERMRLGSLLCEITANDLRLEAVELAVYARQCQLKVSASELGTLAKISEGWISMVYLNFKAYAQNKRWLSNEADIHTLIDQVLLDPLPERQKEFLVLIGITDEFTAEQAAYLWQHEDALKLLDSLSKNNAFITRSDSGIYRYHHMMRQCARQKFAEKEDAYRRQIYRRLGSWHCSQQAYIPAYYAFASAQDWAGLLDALVLDKAKSLNSEHSQTFFDWLHQCPEETLLAFPAALVVCMVKLFSFHNIPEIKRMKKLLLMALEQNAALTLQERNDLLGDAEVAESFLRYNDISAMSAYHRRACALLDRTSLSIDQKGAWTFSAPSILMMYHRTVGGADEENAEMKECMPFYYQVSDGHGKGAEHGFAADLCYERGLLTDADILNRMAFAAANEKNQYSIMLCCEFLSMRRALFEGDYETIAQKSIELRDWLHKQRQYTLLNTLDMCLAFLYALLGRPENAPKWLLEGRLSEALVMFPATPMLHAFYNQLLLAQGEWTAVLARREQCTKLYGIYHNVLCDIRLHIQLAAALDKLGKYEDALDEMVAALNMALPDGILMPFAENEAYILALLTRLKEQGLYQAQIEAILTLATQFSAARQKIDSASRFDHQHLGLSKRELEIARLAAQRKTNHEIAQALCLAEGTVRNQLSRVFDKLGIAQEGKNKRLALKGRLEMENSDK